MSASPPHIAIACGGTGGHLFPGLAVAGRLAARGCSVCLLVSPKDVDQQAVRDISGMTIATLPAVGLTRGRRIAFLRGFIRSYRASRRLFRARRPDAVLAMGGFTSAPPVLAARRIGVKTFLHESNTIPGRANRWLARVVDQAFVGFPEAAGRLRGAPAKVTGTPVRPSFQRRDPAECRAALGLDPARPVCAVMGGSQGATGINSLVTQTLDLLRTRLPELQLVHLAGPADAARVRDACNRSGIRAVVHPFFSSMDLVLGAATVAVSRAGASSLAELAAMRLPSVLIPFPAATDNHQLHNARAFASAGAARVLEQAGATPEQLVDVLAELCGRDEVRLSMQSALEKCDAPQAADKIAESILESAGCRVEAGPLPGRTAVSSPDPGRQLVSVA
ncbi:MAG: undecaprenyldiphospho-muramoylpentapeptide beta-N-acetylglucosaminyltransferase [Verrucomicrobiota bacterium]